MITRIFAPSCRTDGAPVLQVTMDGAQLFVVGQRFYYFDTANLSPLCEPERMAGIVRECTVRLDCDPPCVDVTLCRESDAPNREPYRRSDPTTGARSWMECEHGTVSQRYCHECAQKNANMNADGALKLAANMAKEKANQIAAENRRHDKLVMARIDALRELADEILTKLSTYRPLEGTPDTRQW